MLLKKQRNQLVEILLQQNLSPKDFSMEDEISFKLKYLGNRFEYLIAENIGYEGFVGGFLLLANPIFMNLPHQ